MLNKCCFIGRLGRDPETRTTQNGKVMCTFSLAVSEKHKDKETGEKVEVTEWVNVTAFDKLAEIVSEYVRKGSLLYIEGKMQTRKYDKDGVEMRSVSILLSEMRMLGDRREDNQIKPMASWPVHSHHDREPVKEKSKVMAQLCSPAPDFDDDIPF